MIKTHHYLAKTYQRFFASLNLSQISKSSTAKPSITLVQQTNSVNPRPLLPTSRSMATDADYLAFLDKANRQREAGSSEARIEAFSQATGQLRTETIEQGVNIPHQLKAVDAFYMSETDEPFEPVAIKWSGASKGKWPDNDEFVSLVTRSKTANSNVSDSVEILSEKSFDPRNQYGDVIKAVREAASASSSGVSESDVDVKVYRVEVGHSRIEYWIVALDANNGKIIGLRAKAIET